MALFETSGPPSLLHRSLRNHTRNSMSSSTNPPRYIELPSSSSITTPYIRPPPVPPKDGRYVAKTSHKEEIQGTRTRGTRERKKEMQVGTQANTKDKKKPPNFIQLPSTSPTPPLSPTSPTPPTPPPKSPHTLSLSLSKDRPSSTKPPPRLHLRTLLPTPPLSSDFKKLDDSNSRKFIVPRPVVSPWKWRCCLCGRGYALGVTRRCLEDGHFFCGGASIYSSATSRRSSSGSSSSNERGRRNSRGRIGGRKCGVEFDYGGWNRWGAVRREKRGLEMPGSGSSGFGAGTGFEGVDCGFPGECAGFRRWLRREKGRFGDGFLEGGGNVLGDVEGMGRGNGQEEEELSLRKEMVQRFFDGDESGSSSSSSSDEDGSEGPEDLGGGESEKYQDSAEVEEIRRQFGEGLRIEVEEKKPVNDRTRDDEGDITMSDLVVDVNVGGCINGGTEYPSDFDIPRMIDEMINTGLGDSPPSSPLKEEICWGRSERSELERSKIVRSETDKSESQNHNAVLWNHHSGDLGIREISEKVDFEGVFEGS